jgi:hypothetical protein
VKSFRWIMAIVLAVALFYWKILFSKQFSILWLWESVSQSYSWYHFAAASLKHGVVPLWDPYRFSGSTFIGEMQTGLFYPLKFLAYLMPFDSNGMFSERVYNEVYVVTHILAAVFMFLLARYFRLSNFASFIAGMAFTLCGYLANTGHPHTLDSAIWLPLVVLFFLRSVDERIFRRSFFQAALGGIALGMAVLGGGLHMVIMDGIVLVTMAAMLCVREYVTRRVIAAAGTVVIVGFLFGAVQLLPSLEYSSRAYRWYGGPSPTQSVQKIPYEYLGGQNRFSPRAIFSFLFGATESGDGAPGNYFGVLPLFASVIGAWCCWRNRWVKYFTTLGLVAFLYSWGSFSLIHGLLYLLPLLDAAREASRFIHLTQFAMAILTGFGIDFLYSAASEGRISPFTKILRSIVILLATILGAAALQQTIVVSDWSYLSFFLIATLYALLEMIQRKQPRALTQTLLAVLLLWDAYEFDWLVRNKEQAQAENQDHLPELIHSHALADFLKSQTQPFRIHFDGDMPPNIGDVYGVQMTGGMSATVLTDYSPILGTSVMNRLLNVRYSLRRNVSGDPRKPVFSDGVWNVYENADYGTRAWLVHRVEVNTSKERPLKRLNDSDFDPEHTSIVEKKLDQPLSSPPSQTETADLAQYTATSLIVDVNTSGTALLVLGEIFYPGWEATVNDRITPIVRVDGFLRGVVVPRGTSRVWLTYRPVSVRVGAVLTLVAVIGTAALGLINAIVKRNDRMAIENRGRFSMANRH